MTPGVFSNLVTPLSLYIVDTGILNSLEFLYTLYFVFETKIYQNFKMWNYYAIERYYLYERPQVLLTILPLHFGRSHLNVLPSPPSPLPTPYCTVTATVTEM